MSAAAGSNPATLLARLAEHGWVLVDLDDRAAARLVQPWLLIDGLLGMGAQLTEVQPIRPVPNARSFAASTGAAPLHTDSQLWRGRPAKLQLTACLRPSEEGGESVLVDGFAVAERLRCESPALYRELLQRPRCMRFVFGSVFGATLARRADRYVFTHTPRPEPGDEVARSLEAALAAQTPSVVRIGRGQAMLVDNHRMLHGRRSFCDPERELLRVLAWLERPLGPPPSWAVDADQVQARLAAELSQASAEVKRAFGLEGAPLGSVDAAVFAMLSGAPPGALARRLGLPEALLYRHRDRLTSGGPAAAGDPHDECMRRLESLSNGAN